MTGDDSNDPNRSRRNSEAQRVGGQIRRLPRKILSDIRDIEARQGRGQELDEYINALAPIYRDAAHAWTLILPAVRNVCDEMALESSRDRAVPKVQPEAEPSQAEDIGKHKSADKRESRRNSEERKESDQIRRLPRKIRDRMWDIARATGCGPGLDEYVNRLPPQYREAAYKLSVRLTVIRNVLADNVLAEKEDTEKHESRRRQFLLRLSDDLDNPDTGRGRS